MCSSLVLYRERSVFPYSKIPHLIGAFRQIAKGDCYLRHVCPSALMELHGYHWTDFHEIWYLRIFRNIYQEIQVLLNYDKNNGYFTWRPMYIFWSYLDEFFLKWEMFQADVAYKIKTHI